MPLSLWQRNDACGTRPPPKLEIDWFILFNSSNIESHHESNRKTNTYSSCLSSWCLLNMATHRAKIKTFPSVLALGSTAPREERRMKCANMATWYQLPIQIDPGPIWTIRTIFKRPSWPRPPKKHAHIPIWFTFNLRNWSLMWEYLGSPFWWISDKHASSLPALWFAPLKTTTTVSHSL